MKFFFIFKPHFGILHGRFFFGQSAK